MKRIVCSSVVAALALFCAPTAARAQACYGSITWQNVYNGFQNAIPPAGDFSAGTFFSVDGTSSVVIQPAPFNPEQIVLAFNQNVKVKYLYEEGNNSGVIGWFYWDQIANNANFYNPGTGTLVDKDGDGVKDVFQWKAGARNSDGLWRMTGMNTIPDFLYDSPPAAVAWSDSGVYPHVPNLLEGFLSSFAGGLVFSLSNDDPGTSTSNGLVSTLLPIKADIKSDIAGGDGIPDYDVNGNGVIDEPDRTADLGFIQGGREIVFFYISYGGDAKNSGDGWKVNSAFTGVSGGGTQLTYVMPFFSKSILNADSYSNGLTAGQAVTTIDAGCAFPGVCAGNPGWIDNAASTRLNTATYGNVTIPGVNVMNVAVTAGGFMPHVLAPLTSSWLLGFEDSPIPVAGCGGCTTSDKDYNDAVFLVQHANAASVTSQNITSGIPAPDLGNTVLSKVHVQATVTFPAPCPTPPAGSTLGAGQSTRVDILFSPDNGSSWQPVTFPAANVVTQGTTTIDLVALGIAGNQLLWRSQITTNVDNCSPKLTGLSIGYQSLRHGTFQQTEPIPVGNILVRGQFETPSTSWSGTERTLRGHVIATQLYDDDASPLVDYTDPMGPAPPLLWDAGTKLSTKGADNRYIYYNPSGTLSTFSIASPSKVALEGKLLPSVPSNGSCNGGATGVRCLRNNGSYAYDFNGDFDVTDADADWLIQWSRGWNGGSLRLSQRAWPLGAIVRSSPALVGPPGVPWWYDDANDNNLAGGQKDSAALKSAFSVFQSLWQARRAITISGAQDGLLHAFDSGAFRYGDDPTTNLVENNGYFQHPFNIALLPRDYGDGSEIWAYVPPGELAALKNNVPSVAGFQPGINPRASADAAITVADVCLKLPAAASVPGGSPFCTFSTVVLAAQTRNHPYITALDITNASWSPKAAKPAGSDARAIWASDWTDVDFQGTEWSPSVAPVLRPTGREFSTAITSGLASTALSALYLYIVNLSSGATSVKAQLNVKANGIDCSVATTGGVLGSVGSPVMVDADRDGLVDRIYVADTNGCIYKYNTNANNGQLSVCPLASVGESVYAPLGVHQAADVSGRVEIFAGGGDNPDTFDLSDGTATVPAGGYHLFGFEDDDSAGDCHPMFKLFTVALRPLSDPGGVHKLWSAPSFSNDAVYVATSVGDEIDPCNVDPVHQGVIESFYIAPSVTGQAIAVLAPLAMGAGGGVGGVRLFDNHIITSSLTGSTTVIGGYHSWILNPTVNKKPAFSVPLWMER